MLAAVQRASDRGAMARERGSARDPALHRLGVHPNDVGELLGREPGVMKRGFEAVVGHR